MNKTIVAVFKSRNSAEHAAEQIRDYGLRAEDISIISLNSEENLDNRENYSLSNNNVSGGTAGGAAIGGTAGLLFGMGAFAIPGLGVLTAAGPVSGLIAGGVSGGLIGMLTDLGISPEHGNEYEEIIRRGQVYFSMPVDEETGGRVAKIIKDCGAENIALHRQKI